MRTLDFWGRINCNADGVGGAAGGGPAGGSAAGSDTVGNPAHAAGADAPAPAPEGQSPAPSSETASEASKSIYRPEGLADHLLGENDQQTIDNLAKALEGYRARDSERKVPEDPAAYAAFEGEIPDTIKPHLAELANDDGFKAVAAIAKERGIGVDDLQALTVGLYSTVQDMGLLDAPIDVEAERAALTPDHAAHLSPELQQQAREKRMNENFGFLDLLAGDGKSGVTPEIADFVKVELGDSAKGHQFLEAIRSQIGGLGSGPQPGGGTGQGLDAAGELDRRIGLAANTPGHREFDKGSYQKLQEDLQKHYG